MRADPVRTDARPFVVGILADPNLPTTIAAALARELPHALTAHIDGDRRWTVDTLHEPFEVVTSHDRLIDKARARVHGTNWDIALCITDIPIRTGNGVVVADVSHRDRVALISLPALGGWRLRRRAADVAVAIVGEFVDEPGARGARSAGATRLGRRTADGDGDVDVDVDVELVLDHGAAPLRLLAGTVRANRPWQLAAGLSTALAGAAAGSAFGILYTAIWRMAVVLEPWRLTAASLAALAVFATWLVAGHGLWERVPDDRRLSALLNAATLLTVSIGVVLFSLVLFVLNAAAAALLIPPPYFAEVAGQPVELADYVRVALLSTVMGTVAGAVGSGLENDAAVREAAYSTRRKQRWADMGG
ncbi:hypothetical protein [Pseudonocardia sp. TRM90224]|uniref:hypothetical protein n=1 Tax=Pseudonocardia sp. TRM90224 TaxID=2812678 RepID=UPI001E5F815B|nr:hypothetical protein [Pseudonocardia sp. TRM90224]